MIIIKLDFPTGRWHATAWGSHVNEGVSEWPPCPWRLCRALIAAWYWKHRRNESGLRSLIDKLASELPDYLLPQASAAHTRHYMPVNEGKKESKTKIFDTFVHINQGESLWIRWNVTLAPEENQLLADLLEKLNYMGRAESLIHASLEDSPPQKKPEHWTVPMGRISSTNVESIQLLAPLQPDVYAQRVNSQKSVADKKAKGKNKTSQLPESLFWALQIDTAEWKKEGWNLPPGSHWAIYQRPRDSFKIAPKPSSRPSQIQFPTAARFAIVSKVPPSITQSLSLSERFHQALCKWSDQNFIFTGRKNDGSPASENQHAYFLPECNKHGYVTHMTIHAPGGFDDSACMALGKLRKVWGMESYDVQIVLLAKGKPEDFKFVSPYFQTSKSWISLTPFIPVRHPKATNSGRKKIDEKNQLQIGSPEHDCWRLVKTVIPGAPIAKVELHGKGDRIQHELRDIPCLHFQRNRKTGQGTRAGERGFALRLDFHEPVFLPYGFGYGAHFGLGLFTPVD